MFRRDQYALSLLARRRLEWVDASRGFLPEPPPPDPDPETLALAACQSPALADVGAGEVRS